MAGNKAADPKQRSLPGAKPHVPPTAAARAGSAARASVRVALEVDARVAGESVHGASEPSRYTADIRSSV